MNINLGKPRRLEGPAVIPIMGMLASTVLSKVLMGKGPKAPEIKKTPTAPTPDDAARRRDRERRLASKSRGRASTLMEEDNLG